MSSQSRNAKKPKLEHPVTSQHPDAKAGALPGTEPEKHKLSFAQRSHGEQVPPAAAPQVIPPMQPMKSDAQQRQQKAGSHK